MPKTKQAPATQPVAKKKTTTAKRPKQAQTAQPVVATVTPATKVRPASVRQTVRGLLQQGKAVAEITEVLKAQFPDTAAARLPNKHISYYKSQLRKEQATVQA